MYWLKVVPGYPWLSCARKCLLSDLQKQQTWRNGNVGEPNQFPVVGSNPTVCPKELWLSGRKRWVANLVGVTAPQVRILPTPPVCQFLMSIFGKDHFTKVPFTKVYGRPSIYEYVLLTYMSKTNHLNSPTEHLFNIEARLLENFFSKKGV